MPSSIANIARGQASNVCRSLQQYRSTLPHNLTPYYGNEVCRGDGWTIGNERLSGDFDIDPVLAQQLVGGVLASPEFAVTKLDPGASWLHDYLYGGPSGAPGTSNRLYEEAQSAAIGPGGVLGNVNTMMSAAHAAHASSLEKSIQAGAQKVMSGAGKSVPINPYVTLYNGNTSGKGRPRPRIRITNLPLQTVQPTLGEHFRYSARSQTVTEALKELKLKDLAPKISPLGRVYFRGGLSTGVLTFGPSAALDLIDSINRDAQGKLQFNARHFSIASARSQSGNLAGLVGGAAASTVAGVAFSTVGLTIGAAPLILIGLGGAVLFQIIWNALAGGDWAGEKVRESFE
ncbi:hypothetical protein FAZ95_00430 [Trinickia violacea]|uniref:Uncharacterized protein n=1 Tax=Trinickia violacea TaxID=2571746 RepID=A0A4P8IGP8_9BURK|nr:hypothetical protein [Trinickia violacea]QCP47778.1 hypothetical protein FAZ95_00430 [Trinickia violacea]